MCIAHASFMFKTEKKELANQPIDCVIRQAMLDLQIALKYEGRLSVFMHKKKLCVYLLLYTEYHTFIILDIYN